RVPSVARGTRHAGLSTRDAGTATIRRRMRRLAAAAFLLLAPLAANAWTRASDLRIAQRSRDLAPPDLQLVLRRFEPEFERGIERAESDEGSELHHYFVLSRQGKLRERI